MWNCVTAIHVSTYLRDQLRAWIQTNRYKDEQTDNRVAKETWGSDYLMVWAMATATEGFRKDSLSVATKDSMGMQFLKHTVDASVKLHQYRYTHRGPYFQEVYPQLSSTRQWMHDLWEGKSRGQKGGDEDPETGHGGEGSEAGSDVADWTTDEDEAEWETRLQGTTPLDQHSESSDEDIDWRQCDDIQVA